MNKDDLLILIERYLANQATPEEIKQLDAWYDQFDCGPDLDPELLKMPPALEVNRFCKIGKAD